MKQSPRSSFSLLLLSASVLPFNAMASHWLAGDFHSHSNQSDGDSSVAEVFRAAGEAGLDFLALTDHDNKMGGVMRHWDAPEWGLPGMISLYGTEWTTRSGHGNILASERFGYADFWKANNDGDVRSVLELTHNIGALFSINHPAAAYGTPWKYGTNLDADAIEVWNSNHDAVLGNESALSEFWDPMLRSGRRITAIGGSDTHFLRGPVSLIQRLGSPSTWVLAETRDGSGVLSAVRAGRVTISRDPESPRLEIQGETSEGEAVSMGAEMPCERGTIQIRTSPGLAPYPHEVIAVLRNEERIITESAPVRVPAVVSNLRLSSANYVRAELFERKGDSKGRRLAISNPIYCAR